MNYRKYAMIAVFGVAASGMLSAQSSNVTNTHFAYQAAVEKMQAEDFESMAAELVKAVAEIEPATTHEKTAEKEKTWRYRAQVYELIARNLDKPGVADISTDPITTAAESYMRAMELDPKGSYEVENKRGLAVMQNIAMRNGIDSFNAEKFSTAYAMFTKAEELSAGMGLTDTLAIFNAALSAERGKDYDNSLTYYKKAIEIGYGATEEDKAGLYSVMALIHREKGDEAKSEATIMEGLSQYPSDKGLLFEGVNIYLGKGEDDKALEMLDRTIKQDPENVTLQYTVGAVYDKIGKTEDAREAYKKALVLDPAHFDSNYNLGASFYNEAVEKILALDNIPTNKAAEYKAAKTVADETLRKAIPYLEKAYEIDDTDQGTMASLAECYARTGQLEKRKAIVAKLGQ